MIRAYTFERLQDSLVFAEKFLRRRDIIPRSEAILATFKIKVKSAMEADDDDHCLIYSGAVRAFERVMDNKDSLRGVPDHIKK